MPQVDYKHYAALVVTIATALGTAYLGLAEVWSLPYGGEVQETAYIIAALVATIFAGNDLVNYKRNKL